MVSRYYLVCHELVSWINLILPVNACFCVIKLAAQKNWSVRRSKSATKNGNSPRHTSSPITMSPVLIETVLHDCERKRLQKITKIKNIKMFFSFILYSMSDDAQLTWENLLDFLMKGRERERNSLTRLAFFSHFSTFS